MLNSSSAAWTALCLLVCACLAAGVARAGVVIANTRVVFPGDAPETTVRLTNTRTTPVLVEAWIERDGAAADSRVPFDIVPPLFRIDPGKGQALRIHRAPADAQDAATQERESHRETLFWLNVFESPSVPEGSAANTMHISVRTRIKLFFRPPGLRGTAARAPDRLSWTLVRTQGSPMLRIDNPTPFHVTIARVELGDAALDLRGDMVRPFDRIDLALDAPGFYGTTPSVERRLQALRARPDIHFRFVNDSGGAEPRSARLAGDA